jgi:hypothetical protein
VWFSPGPAVSSTNKSDHIVNICVHQRNDWLAGFMVLNTIFNNISVISWWSDLLVEETAGPGENHTNLSLSNFITC